MNIMMLYITATNYDLIVKAYNLHLNDSVDKNSTLYDWAVDAIHRTDVLKNPK